MTDSKTDLSDSRIDFCIMHLQSAGIETDWNAFREMVCATPSSEQIATATETMMRASGFGSDEIDIFRDEAVADIVRLVEALRG